MKNVKHWGYLVISLLLVSTTFAISCTRDEVPPTQIEAAVQPEIADAMQWFEQQMYSKNYLLNENGMQLYKDWMPDWGKATVNNLPNSTTVEVPITLTKYSAIISSQLLEEYERTKDPKYLLMDIRLVIETDIATGNRQDFIMLISSSIKYLESNSEGRNSYLNMDENFDGVVYYYTPNWVFANGWGFTNGEIDRAISHYKGDTQYLTRSYGNPDLDCLAAYGSDGTGLLDPYIFYRCYENTGGFPNDNGDSSGGGGNNSYDSDSNGHHYSGAYYSGGGGGNNNSDTEDNPCPDF